MISSRDYDPRLVEAHQGMLDPEITVSRVLGRADGDRPAIAMGSEVHTYRELLDAIQERCEFLARAGIKLGHVVGLQSPNTWDFVVNHAALGTLGAVTATLHQPYRDRERARLLESVGAEAWLGRDESGSLGLEPWLGAHLDAAAAHIEAGMGPAGIDPLAIFFTSGTHSLLPKACLHSQAALLGNAVAVARDAGMSPDDVFISASAFTHLFGMLSLHLGWVLGARQVLVERFSPADFLEQCRRHQATVALMVPTHVRDLFQALRHDRKAGEGLHLREIRVAGAAMPAELVQQMHEATGATLINHWGMSELGAGTHTHWQDAADVSARSIGRPVGSARVRIVDQEGRVITEPERVGELQFSGPSLFYGYYQSPDATGESLVKDGDVIWLRSGDLASWDQDDRVRYRGRIKDLINRGGMKISALEVEEAILRMPGIEKAALIPLPDPRLGERGCLVVVVDGTQLISLEAVCQHLNRYGLAKFKWPEALVIREDLPLTPTGKVSKARLCQELRFLEGPPDHGPEKMGLTAMEAAVKRERREHSHD